MNDLNNSRKNVYLICPVRSCSETVRRFADRYVADLERDGMIVHYPPRDADQSEDGIGLAVNIANRDALLRSDEIHVIWDESSAGSHFDLGMAFLLQAWRTVPIILASPVALTTKKSYTNVLSALAEKRA